MSRKPLFRVRLSIMALLALSFAFPRVTLAETVPNDPDFELQWYLSKIQAPLAWDMTTGSKNVVVAILDTGVAYTHPDLKENIWNNPNEALDGVDNDSNGFAD